MMQPQAIHPPWGLTAMPVSLTSTLRCSAAVSTLADTTAALREVCQAARDEIGGQVDFAVLFCSPHHADRADQLAFQACDLLGTENLMGCTGESIVGTGREIE